MIHAALGGKLDNVQFDADPIFGLRIPAEVPGVPREVLHPRETEENVATDSDAAPAAASSMSYASPATAMPASTRA
jgi:phosphoenolpyruvate carboxykinase (ATP)